MSMSYFTTRNEIEETMKQVAKEMGVRVGDIFEHMYDVGEDVVCHHGTGEVIGCFLNKAGDLYYAIELPGSIVIDVEDNVRALVVDQSVRFAINGINGFSTKRGAVISHGDIRMLSGHAPFEKLSLTWHDPENLDGGPLLPGENVTARPGLYFTVHAIGA